MGVSGTLTLSITFLDLTNHRIFDAHNLLDPHGRNEMLQKIYSFGNADLEFNLYYKNYECVSILCVYIARAEMTSIFENQPSKTRPLEIKTRVLGYQVLSKEV